MEVRWIGAQSFLEIFYVLKQTRSDLCVVLKPSVSQPELDVVLSHERLVRVVLSRVDLLDKLSPLQALIE